MAQKQKKRQEYINPAKFNALGKFKLINSDGGLEGNINPIGEGGSSLVYLARQEFDKGVYVNRAVKFFIYSEKIAELRKATVALNNYRDEIVNISLFSHENIIKVIDGGIYEESDEQIPYIVTDYIDGKDLEKILHNEQEFTKYFGNTADEQIKNTFNISLQILQGLCYLHNHHFYHCDIAPKNIMIKLLDSKKQVIICDLGVGHTLVQASSETKKIEVIGSKNYMPEIVKAKNNTSIDYNEFIELQPAWDIHSTKLTLKEIYTKLQAKLGSTPACVEAVNNILQDSIESLNHLYQSIRNVRPENFLIAGVGELSESEPNSKWKPLPINDVLITPRINKIVNHPSMIRLERTPQLLMGSKKSAGNHTRYEHVLGTYENMRRILISLLRNPYFLKSFDYEIIQYALLSALLSSITRFPFSFAIHELRNSDRTLYKEITQTSIFKQILEYKPKNNLDFSCTLKSVISDNFGIDERGFEIITEIVCGSEQGFDNPNIQFVNSLINSSIDVRVLDFLQRDAYHLGGQNNYKFDLDTLSTSIRVHNNKIAINSQGVRAVEQVIAFRYWMYKRFYWNDPSRSYTAMLKHIFFVLADNNISFYDSMCEDILFAYPQDILSMIEKKANNLPDQEKHAIKDMLEMLIGQRERLYVSVYVVNKAETDNVIAGVCRKIVKMKYSELNKVRLQLEAEIKKQQIIDGFGSENKIQLLIDIPNESTMKMGEDINVIKYDGSIAKLQEVSGMAKGIIEGFDLHLQWLRIYIHPEYKDKIKGTQNIKENLHKCIVDFLVRTLG